MWVLYWMQKKIFHWSYHIPEEIQIYLKIVLLKLYRYSWWKNPKLTSSLCLITNVSENTLRWKLISSETTSFIWYIFLSSSWNKSKTTINEEEGNNSRKETPQNTQQHRNRKSAHFFISSALQQRSIEAYTCTDGSNLMIQSNHTFKFE